EDRIPAITVTWSGPVIGSHLFSVLSAILPEPLVIIDVGCRWGFSQAWNALRPNVRIIGFDPDRTECLRLQQLHSGDEWIQLSPRALGPENGSRELHITEDPACSSLYRPDPSVLRSRRNLTCATHVRTTNVDVITLDSWAEDAGIGKVDVIKLDTQGSEL